MQLTPARRFFYGLSFVGFLLALLTANKLWILGAFFILNGLLAMELAERNIRVNAVSPGPVFTEAYREVLGIEDKLDDLVKTIPLGRAGTPEDIAAMVLFLCSPAASWITGEHHLVAGGRTQRSYQYQPKDDSADPSEADQ